MKIDKNGNNVNVTDGVAGFQPTVKSEANTDPHLNAVAVNTPDMVSLDDKGFDIAFGTLSVAEDYLNSFVDSPEYEGEGGSVEEIENDLYRLEDFRNVLRVHQHEYASATPNSMPPIPLTVDQTEVAFEVCNLADDYFESWVSAVEDEGDVGQLAEIDEEFRNVEMFRRALRNAAKLRNAATYRQSLRFSVPEPVQETIPSQLPASSPFAHCNTIEELEKRYEMMTSPENISWDGERNGADVQRAATKFYKEASVRQRELMKAGISRT